MKIILTLMTFLVLQAWGFETPHSAYKKLQVKTPDGVLLKGVRLSRPHARKIILFHGFAENTRIFRELANLLYFLGWDVYMFNFRGHGNGSQKSVNPNVSVHDRTGLYSYDHWAATDVPAIINAVSPDPNEKIVVLGHSLGGDALRIFLSGIRSLFKRGQPAEIYKTSDLEKLNKFANKIELLDAVGSPTNFLSYQDIKFLLWKILPAPLQKIGLKIFSMKKETHSDPDGFRFVEMIQEIIHRSLHFVGAYKGLVGKGYIASELEMARALRKGITYDIPQDIIDDINRWIRVDFESRNKISFQYLTLPSNIRFVQTTAVDDGLAPTEMLMQDTIRFRFHHTPEFVVMQEGGYQHIDMISGKNGALRMSAIITEKTGGESFTYSDLQRVTLSLENRCQLYFAY